MSRGVILNQMSRNFVVTKLMLVAVDLTFTIHHFATASRTVHGAYGPNGPKVHLINQVSGQQFGVALRSYCPHPSHRPYRGQFYSFPRCTSYPRFIERTLQRTMDTVLR